MAYCWNHRFLIFSFLSTGLGSLLATKKEPEFSFGGRFDTVERVWQIFVEWKLFVKQRHHDDI